MSAQSTQILFIDARVSDVDSLLAHVDPSIEVIRLDAAQDGLLQIAQALAGRSGIEALHIVSHGEPGRLVLGSGVVDAASLEAAGAELASIRDALTEQADLLLYGCNVGEGEFGAAFLGALAGATGADVAASVDTTGAAWLGGDWSLEVSTGTIEATALEAPGYEDAMAVTSTVTVTSGPSSSPLPFASRVVNIGFNYGGFGDTQPLAEAKGYYDRDPSHYSTRTVASITAGDVSGLDLLFVFQPANAFTSAQIQVFRDFLTAGGRIFFIGEHNYYAPVPNANISAAIAALGGNISVVTEALSDSLHDNGGDGYKELSNSPLMAGVTSFRTAAFAPLSVETTISKAVMVNDTGRVVIADQALLNGRVTVIADQNWLDDSFRIAGNETFLRNLAADSAGMVETQAQGLPPPPVEPVSNAAPTLTTFAAAVGTVQEEGTVQITLADLKAQGNESDDNGVESFVVKAVTSGTLKIGTSLATATAWVPGSNDVVSGSLNAYWTPAENANGSLNAFTVVARDAAGLTSSPAVQVPVSVTPVNDAPTLASNASLNSISEDQPSDANPGSTVQALFAPRFADVDAGQTLGGIIVTGNSADAVTQGSWQYYSAGQWHDIGSVGSASGLALSASTAIRFAPVANYNGTPPGLTVHGTDSAYAGGYTSGASRVTFDTTSDAVTSGVTVASHSLGVTVTAVNDAPVFTSAAGAATIVDTPADDSGLTASSGSLTGTLTASDVESDASALSFSLRGGSLTGSTWTITGLYGTLTVDAVTGAWAYSPDNETAINALPAGASVVDRFDFKVADPQGAASTQALEITLTGSNDMPQLAAAIADQNFSGAGSWSYQVPAGSITDAEGTGLTYSAELADGSPLPGWLNFDPATRTFSGNPPAAWGDAPLSIRVIAEDDLGETVDDTFDLTLSGTDNQPPVVANPLTWKAVDGVNEITEVVFTGALGGQTVAFDGSGPITLGTAATGAEVATALDAAFDAAVGANYSADIKAGVGNENVLVLTADAAGARSEFSDGATVSIDGGSYDVAVVTEGVTAVAEAVSVRFVAPPAGATELVFDGVTVSLVGLSSASDVAAAVAAALNASGARTWNAEVDGTETDLLHFTSVAVGDRADLGTADFEVVATTTPELASAVSVTQAGSAGVPTEATVYIWPEASERRIAFDGVEVILTGGNTSIQNADAFAATTFPNWTVVHDSGTGHLTFTAKTIDPPLAELANESFTTTDEFGTPTGGLAQVQASTPGEAPAPEVVEVTFTAKPDGVSSLVFDGVTIDLAAASTSQEVAQAVADALNAAPGTATWTASAALGVLTLTADASEARTDLTASDFSATAVNQPSLASSVVVTDGVDEVTEVVELTFTGSYGGATVTLDGVSGSAGSAVTADDVAAAVAGATFTHHTAVASGDTVTFTANDPGDQTDIASGDFTGSYSGTATPSVTTQGAGWSYAIPANTFSDPEGDTLTYSAYILDPMTGDATLLVDSAALSFDEANAILSGDGQVPAGTLIEIRAHDAVSGGTAASQFQLVVYRDAQAASLVAGVVPTTVAFVDGEGSGAWTLPSTAFSYLDDEAGDISYAATLSNGEPLPDWLSFDPATGTFSGNPPAGSDDVEVVVTATAAGGGLSATTPAFTLVVDNANDPLVLSHPVADAQASAGGAIGLTFTKPFTDPDGAADGTSVQTGITYTATANGRPLSDFGLTLGESGGNLTLDGNVPGGTPYLVIEITGTEDNGGSTATTSFTLNLADSAASGDNVAALSANNVGSVTLANQSRPGFAPQQGDTLIVDDVADTDGVDAGTLQYQWQVSSDGVTWTDVAGARGQAQTLTLAQSEVGLQVRAQAFYLDNGGVSESPVSTAMPAVADTADAGSVAFTGALVPGESLSAVITDADGLSGATPTYVWQRSANGVDGWTTIGGATYSSYTLGNDDGGKYLRVLTSYTDDGGFVETNVTSAVRGPVQLGAVAPVGNDDSATVTENSGVGNATAGSPASPVSGNLVGNDTDSNVGDTKTVTGVRLGDFEGVGVAATDGGATLTLQGLYGTLAVTKATGAYTYTLNQSSPDVQRLHVGDTLVEKFNYTVTDSALLSDTAVLSITIQGANDLPRITAGIEATATVVEDAATALPLDFLDVEEWDSNIVQLRLTVDHGTLRAESGGGVTVAGSDTGVLILSATDAGTLSSWLFQNDVSYVTDPNLNGAVATLSYEAGDEAGYVAASGTTALTATATNDAPIVDAGGAGSAGNDAAVTFRPRGDAVSVAPALTLSDIDSSTLASATVTLASGARDNQFGTFYETLGLSATGQTLADAAGLSVASTPSSSGAVLTLTGSASLAEYQAVLREVLYHNGNPNAFSADRTVTISVTDGAGALSNTASFETTAVNTDIAVGQRIFVDGVDSGHLVAQVLDSRHFVASGELADLAAGAVLTFRDDGGLVTTATAQGPLVATTTVHVPWTPVIDMNGGGAGRDRTIGYTEGQGAVAIATADASITDQGGLIRSLTVTLTNPLDNGHGPVHETLSAPSVTVMGWLAARSITASGNGSGANGLTNATEIVFTASGAGSDATNFQVALRGVTYTNTSQNPDPTQRVVHVASIDVDGNTGVDADTFINPTSVNDAPEGVDSAVTAVEDTAYVFAATDFGFGDPTDDADGAPDALASVLLSSLPASGVLYLDGVAVTAGQEVSVADITAGRLTYVPADDANGAAAASFTFQVRDDGGVTDGGVDLDATPATMTLHITATNDAPVLRADGADLAEIDENAVANAGQTVAALLGTIADVDVTTGAHAASNGVRTGMAVYAVDDGGVSGTWQYSLDGGDTWAAIGLTADHALLLRSTDFVRFVPDAVGGTSANDLAKPSLSYYAWDQSVGSAGTLVDTTQRGGTTALSQDGDTLEIAVADVNDAPVITAPGAQTVAEDDSVAITGLSFGDVDVSGRVDGDSANDVLTVTLSVGHGTITLADLTDLTVTAGADGSATVTLQGSLAALNNAVATLTYAPDADYTGADALSVEIDDGGNVGSGGTLSASTSVAITVTGVNDAPVATPAAPSFATIDENDTGHAGNLVSDLVDGLGQTGIVDVDTGAANEFTGQGIAVHGLAHTGPGAGTWQFKIGSGPWQDVGLVDASQALLLGSSDSLRFVPDEENATTATLSYYLWDGASGAAGSKVDVSTRGGTTAFSLAGDEASIEVTPVNDAPTLDINGSGAGIDGDIAFSPRGDAVALFDANLTIGDVDDGDILTGAELVMDEDYTLDNAFGTTYETLATTAAGGIYTGSLGAITISGNGTSASPLLLSGQGTAADYKAALLTLVYDNTNPNAYAGVRPVSVTVYDAASTTGGAGATGSAVATLSIQVNWGAVADLNGEDDLGRDHAVAYTENASGVMIVASDASLTDQDGNIASVTVTLTNPQDGASEWLFVDPAQITAFAGIGITVSGNNSHEITLTGDQDGTYFQLALRAIQYRNVLDSMDTTPRVVTVESVDVDGHVGVSATTVVNPVSVDDLPTGSVTLANDTDAGRGTTAARQGDVLSVSNTLADADGMTTSTVVYQWMRDGVAVDGATGTTYTLTQDDVDAVITVVASYTDDDGYDADVPSAPTNAIVNVNDAPGLTSGDQDGEVDEDGLAGAGSASGQLTLTDLDPADTHSYTIEPGDEASHGTASVDANGAWTYVVDDLDALVDALADGETLSDSFTLTVTDDGTPPLSVTQVVNLLIRGANDAPVVTVVDVTGAVTEDVQTAGELLDSGSVTFADVDGSDVVTASVALVDAVASVGASVSEALNEALATALAIDRTGSANHGSVAWDFALDNTLVQYLGAGETVTVTYRITLTDDSGTGNAEATQDVTLVIGGANDAPTIATVTPAVAEDDQAATTTDADLSGSLGGADVDANAVLVYGISGGVADLDGDGNPTGTVSRVGSFGTLTVDTVTGAYSYVKDAAAIEALDDGETPTDSFTVTVDDGVAAVVSQPLVVSFTGADDAPTLAAPTDASVAEDEQAAATTDAGLSGSLVGDDVDGETLTYGIVGGTPDLDGDGNPVGTVSRVGAYGTLTVDVATGAYSYAKNAAAIEALDDGESDVDAFTFSVDDGDGDLVTQAWQVAVTGADDAPTLAAVTAGSIVEVLDSPDTTASGLSGTLAGADVDVEDLTYGIDGGVADLDGDGNPTGTVRLAGSYGTLVVNTATGAWEYLEDSAAIDTLQVGESDTDSFTMTVSDGDGAVVARPWSVTLGGANDSPSDIGLSNATVVENTPIGGGGLVVGSLSTIDPDHDSSFTYAIVGGQDALFFDVVAGNLVFRNGTVLNAELKAGYDVVIRSTDPLGLSTYKTFLVSVSDVNEFGVTAPVFDVVPMRDGLEPNTIPEDAEVGDFIGVTAEAIDGDATNNTVSYSLVGNLAGAAYTAGEFTIDAATGEIFLARTFDRETDGLSRTVYVKATSADGSSAVRSLNLTIADVDEYDVAAPVDIDPLTDAVVENAAVGSSVGVVARSSDADATTNAVTYRLVNEDGSPYTGGEFAIGASSGIVTVAGPIDREAGATRTLYVEAASADGSTAVSEFTVAVADVNDSAPMFGSGEAGSVEENTPTSTVIYTAQATDADPTPAFSTVTYALKPVDDAVLLDIDAVTGQVTLRASADYEAKASYTFTVLASDGLHVTEQSVTVDVTPMEEEATGTLSVTGAAEEGGTLTAELLAADADGAISAVDYRWQEQLEGIWTDIDGADSAVLSLSDAQSEVGRIVRAVAVSTDALGGTTEFVGEAQTIANVDDPAECVLQVFGNAEQGGELYAQLFTRLGGPMDDLDENGWVDLPVDPDGAVQKSFQWQGLVDGNWVDIPGAASASLQILDNEAVVGRAIRVVATTVDELGGTTRHYSEPLSIADVDNWDVTDAQDVNAAANVVAGNATAGSTIGITAQAVDADVTATVRYSLVEADGREYRGREFAVDAVSGVVTVGSALDRNVSAVRTVHVKATSDDGSSSISAFTVTLAGLERVGGSENDRMIGSAAGDTLFGAAGHDSLSGEDGDDVLVGEDGNDTMVGGNGTNRLVGGNGDDLYVVTSSTDTIVELPGQGHDRLWAGVNYTLGAGVSVENLTLMGSARQLTGNELANAIWGSSGDDTLSGQGGDDTLSGGLGHDTLVGGDGRNQLAGGAGDDLYVVTSASDRIVEWAGQGLDRLWAGVNYTLGAGVSVERLTLMGSARYLAGNELANGLWGTSGDDTLSGQGGADSLSGGGGNDSLLGGDGNDILDGGQGNDTLVGGDGTNRLVGGAGDDLYVVTSSSDRIDEWAGQGQDRIWAGVDYTLAAGVSVERLTLMGSARQLTGNELANALWGTVGDDMLSGLGGDDSLSGGVGNDSLLGGDSNDVMDGGQGNDTLVGGSGSDRLTGGAGADQFVFDAALNGLTNVDRITDFAAGDTIKLSALVFTQLTSGGSLAPSQFHAGAGLTGATAGTPGAGIFYDTASGALHYDADGVGGVAAVKFAIIGSGHALTADDFVVGS